MHYKASGKTKTNPFPDEPQMYLLFAQNQILGHLCWKLFSDSFSDPEYNKKKSIQMCQDFTMLHGYLRTTQNI